MLTMIDEMFDRDYQHGRAELNAGIDRATVRVTRFLGDTWKALHRIEWSAPWDAKGTPTQFN
jgi:hypothetical protein